MKSKQCVIGCIVLLSVMRVLGFAPLVQTAREIPVIRDADVVVVGGGSAAVAAAIAAKTNGASVFLVAPRTYLGDDLAGTRELWLAPVPEVNTQPLAQKIFKLNMPFSYTTSIAAEEYHSDNGGTRLTDGVQYNAASGSVQFNNNVAITIVFAGTGTVTQVDLYYYYRSLGTGFDTVVSGLEYSDNGSTWSTAAISVAAESLTPELEPTADHTYIARVTVSGALRAKYLRLTCSLAPEVTRQLLDEVVIHTSLDDPIPGTTYSATPLAIKRSLEAALEDAGIPFLGGSPVSDVLKDANGDPSGVVLVNRKGRQAVTARVVIDATESAWPAQQAGADKTAFAPGEYSFSRIVIADATNAPATPGMSVYPLPGVTCQTTVTGVDAPAGMPASVAGRVYRCTFSTNLVSGSISELLEVEQAARDMTWVKSCIDQADRLSWMPPDTIVGTASETTNLWPGAAAVNLDAFRPQAIPYLYVLGVRADVSRALAQAMSHPVRMMTLADRIGAAAAADALARASLTGVVLPADTALPPGTEAIAELLNGLPPVNTNAQGVVAEGIRALPVLAECEVLVVGAGTAGAPAAIAAGRAGADTLVIDFLCNMGGVQTDGRIGRYYSGNPCGFTTNDIDPGWQSTGSVLATAKAEWYRQACREANVRVLFGTLAAGVVIDNGAVKGVVVVLPDGQRGVIRAQTVVDSTGNADIAAAAGAETEFITASEPAVQGAGLAPHVLGNSSSNTDVGFVNDTDVADIFFFARRARASMAAATWDAGQNPASRERRRLVGAVTVSPIDILNNRTYPDTIALPRSDFDTHGFTVHDLFFVQDLGATSYLANLPLRALVPKTLDGLLVTGLGISAHRDAMPLLRMQRDVQNQGYAAGYASALAVQDSVTVRNVDIAALQAHLVSKGIIGAANTNNLDSFPLAPATIQSAVTGLTNNYATLHTVLADTNTALPLLRAAYTAAADEPSRLIYAHVLGLLYDPIGAESLISAVSASPWDIGWSFKGMGQVGRSVSLMDSYIIALGRTHVPYGIVPVLAKATLFDPASAFSHVRAVSLALENLGGGSSVDTLSSVLAQMRGYALTNALTAPLIPGYSSGAGDTERNFCLKELAAARALYRLGDDEEKSGTAVLTDYAFDPREVYASHARQVLAGGVLSPTADGVWIGTEANAVWSNASEWQNNVPASGYGATAYFTNAVAGEQSISLQGALQTIGSLIFGGLNRTTINGLLDISGPSPEVTVEAGSRATLAADVIGAHPVTKKGAGELVFAGPVTLGGLDLTAGDVRFSDPDIQIFQAYEADTALHNTSVSGSAVSLRTNFRVNHAIAVTHLGAYDSNGDGFESYKKVAIYAHTGGTPLAVLAFVSMEDYPLENGYRFRKLPSPLYLPLGDYAVVTFGFTGADRYIKTAQTGMPVGTLEEGNGALTFLTGAYSSIWGVLSFPTTVLSPTSAYAVTAGSFRFATGTTLKSITGAVTLSAASKLDAAALDVQLTGGLLPGEGGFGTVTNASAAYPMTLTLGVPDGQTNQVPATVIGDRADGPLALVKAGTGTLKLTGPLGFRGGLSVDNGVLEIDSPAALGGGELSFGTGGKLALQAGGTLDKIIYVPSQAKGGYAPTRLVARSGSTLTLTRGIQPSLADTYSGFAIQPHDDVARFSGGSDDGMPLTSVIFDGADLGYLDLYLVGDALPGSGRALHLWKNVRGGLRKLTCGSETVDGCDVVFGEGCDFSVGWLDIAGSNAVVSITNNAVIRSGKEVRFMSGQGTQLSLDGGLLQVNVIGGTELNYFQHLPLKPILFNGTRVQATTSSDTFLNLSEDSAAPLIRNGGAIFDTQSHEVAIRGKGFAQAPGSTGAFVKLGAGTLKIAAPMTYTGLTLVSNGTLRLDFALWNPTNTAHNLLSPAAEVQVSAGAAFEVLGATNTTGVTLHSQTLDRLVTADTPAASMHVEQADLAVSALEGAWTKTGSGQLTLACRPDHSATFSGVLNVQEGSFAVRSFRANVTVNVPYPSFESTPLLPNHLLSYLFGSDASAGCPGWTFSNTGGNNYSGYQRNKSNFSKVEVSDSHTTNGVQTAVIRKAGEMETALTFPISADYTLRFIYCPREALSRYANHVVNIYLGGVLKDTLTTSALVFTERVVELGYVTAGTHTLRFAGAATTDLCTLIDNVRITGYTGIGGAGALSSDTSSLTLADGVQAELDYPGSFTVGELVLNGTRYYGGYYGAVTHPDIFTGTGMLHAKSGGTVLILR
ncbi:MAG: FAD-dependent oxidoreductase [Kiritimatiellia bacterium]